MTWEGFIGQAVLYGLILWITPLGSVLWTDVVKVWKKKTKKENKNHE